MKLRNKKGVSTEVLKIAAAMIIALAVFALLLTFALGPKAADEQLEELGESILNNVQNASFEIENY
jgi:hypothetical protein